MSASPTPDDVLLQRHATLQLYNGSKRQAAKHLGISRSTLQRSLLNPRLTELLKDQSALEFPEFPDDDIPVEQELAQAAERFEKRYAAVKAHEWFTVKVNDPLPIGILWFGDPHIDDNGCNLPRLMRDVELCRDTEGLYGANIGDTTNNWAGRLVKLYANQDASLKTARRRAKWFMLESGIVWLVWLMGNHDIWNDGAEALKLIGANLVPMHDWESRFILEWPDGSQIRINAAHDFKGHSQWNENHGPMKESRLGPDADLIVCGHKHNWHITTWENANRGLYPTIVRVRGYKTLDEYARHLGIREQETGASILTIIRPHADDPTGRVQAFTDVEFGAQVLTQARELARESNETKLA